VAAVAVLGAAALALAACGSSSAASSTSTTKAPSSSAPSGGSTGGGASGGGSGGGTTARQFPGADGTIAAINGASLEVQGTSGQTTVTYTGTTTFDQTVTASASDVTVGSCISAFGKPTSTSSSSKKTAFGGPVTATTVSITQPTSGSCSTGFGGGFGGFRGGAGGAGTGGAPAGGGSGAGGSGSFRPPSGSGSHFPGAGNFGAASGQVTAVNGSAVTVSETNPQTKATTSVVVTLTASTTFTQRETASSSDLAVGKCAQARGSASTTGAITATAITISTPTANGCSSGFGGFRGGAGGAGAGAPPSA
jgi:hypothetical protein